MDGNRAVSVDHHASSLTQSLETRHRAKAGLRLKAGVQALCAPIPCSGPDPEPRLTK
jgi:hypothetical protein